MGCRPLEDSQGALQDIRALDAPFTVLSRGQTASLVDLKPAWEDLAGAVEHAAKDNAGASAAKRLGAIGLAYRAWGTAQPHRYRLALQTPLGSGELAPERVIPAAQRCMAAILDAIESLPAAR